MKKVLITILKIIGVIFLMFVGLIIYLMFFDMPSPSTSSTPIQETEYIDVQRVNEKKQESEQSTHVSFWVSSQDVNHFKNFLKESKPTFTYQAYYGIDQAYQIYQSTSYTTSTSTNLLNAEGKLDVDLLIKQVNKNNEDYLNQGKTAVSTFFKPMAASDMRKICELICRVVNDELFGISPKQMLGTLSHLKIFERSGSAANAYVSEELVFAFNPTMTSMYSGMLQIQDKNDSEQETFVSVIVHEIMHLLQYGFGDQIEENGLEAGICRKYESTSALWYPWLLEAGAEVGMANYLDVEAGTYQKKISYANSYNLSRFYQTSNRIEIEVFNPNVHIAIKELNESDLMNFLNLLYSIEVTQSDPEEFWVNYGQEVTDERKLEIRMEIRQEVVSEMTYHYYMGLINAIRDGKIKDLNTLFYMMRLWEMDAYGHLEYTKADSIDAATPYIIYHHQIQEKLFEIIGKNVGMSIEEMWDAYNSYSIYVQGNINASLDGLNPIVGEILPSINTANFSRNKTVYEYIKKEAK